MPASLPKKASMAFCWGFSLTRMKLAANSLDSFNSLSLVNSLDSLGGGRLVYFASQPLEQRRPHDFSGWILQAPQNKIPFVHKPVGCLVVNVFP